MSRLIDLTGQRFGHWRVLGLCELRGKTTYWYCVCDCGVERWVSNIDLKRGKSRSCGCASPSAMQFLTGQRFGEWTVTNHPERHGCHTYWRCRCDCGVEKWVQAGPLKTGKSRSCGHKESFRLIETQNPEEGAQVEKEGPYEKYKPDPSGANKSSEKSITANARRATSKADQ